MKKNSLPGIYLSLPILIFSLLLSSCSNQGKSDLVKRLESIFYKPGFANIPDRNFSVSDYGSVGDGKALETKAIQMAIDAANESGGGVVSFPRGTYLSGAIFLKSNVELHIGEGVVIRAIQDNREYPEIWTRIAGVEMYWPAALINVYEQENVRITGKGTIDGNGKYWWDKFWGDPPLSGGMWVDYNARGLRWALDYDCKRVRAVVVYDSREVLLKDFTVKQSGFWTITMTYSNRVHVDGVVIRNNIDGYGPSSDGINTDSSSDILVENCDIDCNDDNLCIKAGKDADGLRVNRPAENIVYRNSTTRAGHGLITLGSETSGGMRNIEVYGLKAVGTTMGIRFKSAKVRGGIVENIRFHHIEMENVSFPFHFEMNWYPAYSYPVIPEGIPKDSIPARWIAITNPVQPPERGIPEFRNLYIGDVTVKKAKQAFYVNAYPEKSIHNLIWENISIEAAEPGIISYARDWTMNNVTLDVPGSAKIELINCVNVQLPAAIRDLSSEGELPGPITNSDNLLARLKSDEPGSGIRAMDEKSVLISQGDTLFSDTIEVVINPEGRQSFSFYEPLGDGFYFSPVNIEFNMAKNQLTVSGERSHEWIFHIKTDKQPGNMNGINSLEYDVDHLWLTLKKPGTKFEILLE